MSCGACQVWSGGNHYGAYQDFWSPLGLKSTEEYFYEYSGGIRLDDSRMQFVQIVVYNLSLVPANASDAMNWQNHFKLQAENTKIFAGPHIANGASFNMIPGFILLDKNMTVLYDATGHSPKHNLYTIRACDIDVLTSWFAVIFY